MPIPHEQAPPEPKRILVDEDELDTLRKAKTRYDTLREISYMQFRAIKKEEARGFLTFGELVDQLQSPPEPS